MTRLTRRGVLAGSAAIAAGSFSVQVRAAPEPQKITPALIEAAKKEGKLFLVHLGRPAGGREDRQGLRGGLSRRQREGRAGAERIFQRIGQEYFGKIYNCDVVNSSDAAHSDHLEARLDAGLVPARGGRQVFPKEHWIPTACMPRGASRSRPSPTTPTW